MRFALVVFNDILYMKKDYDNSMVVLLVSEEIFILYSFKLLVMIYEFLYFTILSIVNLREKLVLKGCKVIKEIR